jgi:hypothetical protein
MSDLPIRIAQETRSERIERVMWVMRQPIPHKGQEG